MFCSEISCLAWLQMTRRHLLCRSRKVFSNDPSIAAIGIETGEKGPPTEASVGPSTGGACSSEPSPWSPGEKWTTSPPASRQQRSTDPRSQIGGTSVVLTDWSHLGWLLSPKTRERSSSFYVSTCIIPNYVYRPETMERARA